MFFVTAFSMFLAAGALAVTVVKDPSISAFKKVGNIIDGVDHAHIRVTVNISAEREAVINLHALLTRLKTNSTMPVLWTGLESDILPLQRKWTELTSSRFTPRAPRQTRQVFIVGAAVGAAAVSAGAGLWALHETSVLQDRMDDEDGRVRKLAVSLHSALHLEHDFVAQMEQLGKAVVNVENKIMEMSDFERITKPLRSLVFRMSRRYLAVEATLSHRFERSLLDDAQRENMFAKLQHRVYQAGYQLVREGEDQLYQNDISYSIKNDILNLFIHVNVYPKGNEFAMSLFQHLPLPVRRNGTLVTVHSAATHLAMDASGELFVELTPADLLSCVREGSDWACSTVFPRSRGGARSCLTALFLHHTEAAEERCHLTPVVEAERWFHLNATAFVTIGRVVSMIQVNCAGVQSTVGVKGLNAVGIERGCVATSDLFRFSAVLAHLPSELHFVVQVPSLDNTDIIELSTKSKFNSTTTDTLFQTLDDLEDVVAKDESEIPRHSSSWSTLEIFSMVSASVLLAAGVYFCFRKGATGRHLLASAQRRVSQRGQETPAAGVRLQLLDTPSSRDARHPEMAIIHEALYAEDRSPPAAGHAFRRGSLVSQKCPTAPRSSLRDIGKVGLRRRSGSQDRDRSDDEDAEVRRRQREDRACVLDAREKREARERLTRRLAHEHRQREYQLLPVGRAETAAETQRRKLRVENHKIKMLQKCEEDDNTLRHKFKVTATPGVLLPGPGNDPARPVVLSRGTADSDESVLMDIDDDGIINLCRPSE